MPTACRKLYTTTGPMKQKPSSLNAALIRSDSAVFAAGAGAVGGIAHGLPLGKRPEPAVEGTLARLNPHKGAGVPHHARKLARGMNDARRFQQRGKLRFRVSGEYGRLEIVKGGAHGFPLREHGGPRKAALHHLERQKLKQRPVVVTLARAPFLIVIAKHLQAGQAPWTAFFFVHLSPFCPRLLPFAAESGIILAISAVSEGYRK